MELLYRLPDVVVAAMLAAAVALPCWLLPILAARLFGARAEIARSTAALEAIKLIGPLTAVFLVFSLVQSTSHFRRIELAIGKEATDISQLDRALLRLQTTGAEPARASLRAYTEAVVRQEFPALRRGLNDPRTAEAFDRLILDIGALSVANSEPVVTKLDDVDDDRTLRLENIGIHLPWFFWQTTLLLLTALVILIAQLQPGSPLARMMTGYAAALGVLVALQIAVDSPFRGGTSVSPQPFENALASIHAR